MFVKAKRPDDGEILEVSEKLFNISLSGHGWTLAKAKIATSEEEKAEQEKPVKKDK